MATDKAMEHLGPGRNVLDDHSAQTARQPGEADTSGHVADATILGGAILATEPKYQNKKIVVDSILFDSKDEARYYETLKRRQQTEGLTFTRQPKLLLIPSFRMPCGALQRAITYSADFLVTYSDSTQELIDIKGFSTQQGDLKRKLYNFLAFQPDRPVPGIPLRWVAYSQKYGDKDGWIDYDDLHAKRRKAKKEKLT